MDHSEINIVLFDGVCNLCNSTVQFIIRNDAKAKFRFASVQNESGQLLLKQLDLPLDHFDTLVYISDSKFYLKSTAVFMILRELGGGWRLLYFFIIFPRFLRDMVYDFIAKWRYKWFGKREECIVPAPKYSDRFLE
ncbi:MAG TPA: thiol-disulfide oxidoreductase DCC family protein [Prolixibacteraceae bacterium]|nr:thiol-disulfide oxidoreductase DCC family protein [Prolixibacteraceae bacterium]